MPGRLNASIDLWCGHDTVLAGVLIWNDMPSFVSPIFVWSTMLTDGHLASVLLFQESVTRLIFASSLFRSLSLWSAWLTRTVNGSRATRCAGSQGGNFVDGLNSTPHFAQMSPGVQPAHVKLKRSSLWLDGPFPPGSTYYVKLAPGKLTLASVGT